MKHLLLVCSLVILAAVINAQKVYFIYLQTETHEPFFVRMSDNLYSSTESGYLILSKLRDSIYAFKLGFPGKNIDLDFKTSINKKDHGYLIKNLGEKGWGLFDLQTLSLQISSSSSKASIEPNTNSNSSVSAFTALLSKAVDDPSLKQNVVFVKEEEKKPQPVEAVVKEEKKPDITESVVKEERRSQPVSNAEEKKTESLTVNEQKTDESLTKSSGTPRDDLYRKSQVTKISETATFEGYETVFIDQYPDGRKDTVRILVPGAKETAMKEELKVESQKEEKKFFDFPDTAQSGNKAAAEVKKEEAKKWWQFGKNKSAETDKGHTETREKGLKWWPFNKNKEAGTATKKCAEVANNDDFLRLRRRMASRTNDEGMLDEARKYFKEKCFSTEQIKNLSSMFLSNAGKYNFFEIAHDSVSDKENFPSLQSELKDEDYVNRFRNLVGN
jgi:Domain of unknown function (DUF4476)